MADRLRVLIVAQPLAEAEKMVDALRVSGSDPDWRVAKTDEEFSEALDRNLDLILVYDDRSGLAAAALVLSHVWNQRDRGGAVWFGRHGC